jgi:hypothetical protein
LRHRELLKYVCSESFLSQRNLVSVPHNRFYQDNFREFLNDLQLAVASQRAKMQPFLAARPILILDDELDVGKSIVSFPISPTHGVDARSLLFRGGSWKEDAMRSRMLYVPPEGGQRFNHDR